MISKAMMNCDIINLQMFKLINTLIIHSDYTRMSTLIDLAFNKDYLLFLNEVLDTSDNYNDFFKGLNKDIDTEPINIINGCLFVVKELDPLIKLIKQKNYNVNTGPQSLRGQINSISSSLSVLDMDYRDSLYNHHSHHVLSGNLHSSQRLNKNKFFYNNIHMNLGGVRWYSTSTKNIKIFNRIAESLPNKNNDTSNSENSVSIINPDTEDIITVVHGNAVILAPDSKNKITVVARMSYNNASTMKQKNIKREWGQSRYISLN